MTPEQGGGLLLDLGSHLVDQALQHFGPVQTLYAEIANRRGMPADDDVFLALTHSFRHDQPSARLGARRRARPASAGAGQ